jgi:hypothetical protein
VRSYSYLILYSESAINILQMSSRDDQPEASSSEVSDIEFLSDQEENYDDFEDDFQSSSNSVEVDLSQMYLEALPVSFFFGKNSKYCNHSRIVSLNLSQNRLLQLPPLICNRFKNLVK